MVFSWGKIHNGIAVRVPAAEVLCPNFLAAEKYGRLVGKDNARRGNRGAGHVRLLAPQNIRPGILCGDDVGSREKFGVSAAMVLMVVGIDDVFDRLLGDRLDPRRNGIVVLLKLVVDQDHAFSRNQHGDIAAVALDLIKVVVHLVDGQLRRLALILCISNPGEQQEQQRGAGACDQSSVHGRNYHELGHMIGIWAPNL
jgi:hypothetical protein